MQLRESIILAPPETAGQADTVPAQHGVRAVDITMNPDMARLQPYPFERLARLFSGVSPPAGLQEIALSIGEPRHATPGFIAEEVITHLHGLSNYPLTRGSAALRAAVADWLTARFALPPGSIDPENMVLPVNGTREALFAFAQCAVDRSQVCVSRPFACANAIQRPAISSISATKTGSCAIGAKRGSAENRAM